MNNSCKNSISLLFIQPVVNCLCVRKRLVLFKYYKCKSEYY